MGATAILLIVVVAVAIVAVLVALVLTWLNRRNVEHPRDVENWPATLRNAVAAQVNDPMWKRMHRGYHRAGTR